MKRQRIAVIGAGVSGIVAAHYLARRHDVVLFEAEDRLGGHTNTIDVGPDFGSDAGLPVDTGFIVYNERTYPHLIQFFKELGIEGSPTDMTFSFSDPSRNFAYAGSGLNGLLAYRRQAFDPGFWAFLASVFRFNRRASRDLQGGGIADITLEAYLDQIKAPQRLRRDYLSPMIQAIWSSPGTEAIACPAESFIRFFANHGLLSRPGSVKWRYLKGGSRRYIQAFQDRFPGEIRVQTPVSSVARRPEGPLVRFPGGEETFQAVVLAAHADQTLAVLEDPDEREQAALAPWRYSRNRTVLHCDVSHMPPRPRAWACWNILRHPEDADDRPVRVTYWMNSLQRLEAVRNWLVSLNPGTDFSPGSRAYETVYEHPVYSLESMAAQRLLPELSGRRQTYFCGSYHGYGFHEDGARSGVEVARQHFGVQV